MHAEVSRITHQCTHYYPSGQEILHKTYFHIYASCGRHFQDTTKYSLIMVREEMKSKHQKVRTL